MSKKQKLLFENQDESLFFQMLPKDCILYLLDFLTIGDKWCLKKTCKLMRNLVSENCKKLTFHVDLYIKYFKTHIIDMKILERYPNLKEFEIFGERNKDLGKFSTFYHEFNQSVQFKNLSELFFVNILRISNSMDQFNFDDFDDFAKFPNLKTVSFNLSLNSRLDFRHDDILLKKLSRSFQDYQFDFISIGIYFIDLENSSFKPLEILHKRAKKFSIRLISEPRDRNEARRFFQKLALFLEKNKIENFQIFSSYTSKNFPGDKDCVESVEEIRKLITNENFNYHFS